MVVVRLFRLAAANRRLLLELARREIRGRFVGSRAGLLWSVLNPLVQLVSYGVIFGFVYRAADGDSRTAFLSSLFCGLFPWWAFQESATRGLAALVDQAALLKRTPLPPEICVLSAVIGSFALQSLGFLVFLAIFVGLGLVPLGPGFLLLPVALCAALLLAAGVALSLAPVHLVVRDTVHVVNAVFTILFFASPVLYRLDALPERLARIAAWNPVAGVIGLYRLAVLGMPFPSLAPLLSCLVAIAVVWWVGATLFDRLGGHLDEYW